ncbi:hypothetical protein COO60DRAFT_1500511 [Scenedesmus sp. NREL 46B-D3]|nr:hypothetical protein COO60DRAFT_1500511 [Scenedesmus sp. NREL 46B-D3]
MMWRCPRPMTLSWLLLLSCHIRHDSGRTAAWQQQQTQPRHSRPKRWRQSRGCQQLRPGGSSACRQQAARCQQPRQLQCQRHSQQQQCRGQRHRQQQHAGSRP